MKILVVSQYFWPENFSINAIAKYLKQQGHEVDALTGIPNYPQGEFYEGYSLFKNLHQKYHGIHVDRVWMKPRGKKGGDKRLLLNYATYAMNASIAMLGRLGKGYDATFVYAMSPISQAYPALLLRALKKVPLCLYVGDLWPDTLFSHGFTNRVLKKTLVGICSFIYRRSDNIIVTNESFIDPVRAYAGGDKKIVYIPQAVEKLYKPVRTSGEFRASLGIKANDFLVMYAGNIGFAQSVMTIVQAATLVNSKKEIHFVFVGDGSLRVASEEFCKEHKLSNCHFVGRKPQEEMPNLIAEADVMLVTLKNQGNYNLTLPGRTQAFMACGKPIICCANGETARVITEAKAGMMAEAENPDQLAQCIMKCADMDMDELYGMGLNGQQYSKIHYDMDKVFGEIKTTLENTKYEGD